MTIPQIQHAMGFDNQTPTQAAEFATHRRKEMLDQIVKKNNWQPTRLLDLPISDIAQHLSGELENGSIDPQTLTGFIEQYVRQFTQHQ
jgi:hypothetical protein